MDLQLTGKRALVTGGSRGIGRVIAKALLDEGARVVIAARDADAVARTTSELANYGEIYGVAADTTQDASVDALIAATASHLGGIDIVVNAAAKPGGRPAIPGLAGVTSEFFLEELNTKVVGYLRVARAAAPYLVAQGWGRIINIGGLAARQAGSTVASARNVAVAAVTKNLAEELGPKGINVTTVHPGATRTERTASSIAAQATAANVSPEEAERQIYGNNLIGRIVEAEELANVVLFLASPRSVAINGDTIAVGGGAPRAIHY